MHLISWIAKMVVVLFVGVHLLLYLRVGTVNPCSMAVEKQQAELQRKAIELILPRKLLYDRQGFPLMPEEKTRHVHSVMQCYLAAMRGDALPYYGHSR